MAVDVETLDAGSAERCSRRHVNMNWTETTLHTDINDTASTCCPDFNSCCCWTRHVSTWRTGLLHLP